ncbi:MAG TPA: hypothetical protein VHH34_18505, partial [Pseudonocardiaceae bacterium]|nr:hypothetical protein [Pseudonocardiaceae bacterium]
MSSQSPETSSVSTEPDGDGKKSPVTFGANEWLVDEIYQQYLQDPNSVDRAWWDFFADYKPGPAGAGTQDKGAPGGESATGAGLSPAEAGGPVKQAPAPSAPAQPAATQPASAPQAPAAA